MEHLQCKQILKPHITKETHTTNKWGTGLLPGGARDASSWFSKDRSEERVTALSSSKGGEWKVEVRLGSRKWPYSPSAFIVCTVGSHKQASDSEQPLYIR